jgi:hypothetical protein
MYFKPSAGIFVSGLLLSILGTIFGFIGMGVASSGSYYDDGRAVGGGTLVFLGFGVALTGIIMVYVGASRALKVIDALPSALKLVPLELQQQLAQQQQASRHQHQPNSPLPPQQQVQPPALQQRPYVAPKTPQHLVYNEPRGEQQPPVQ